MLVVGHLLLLLLLPVLIGVDEASGEQIERETLDNSRNLRTIVHVKAFHVALVETVRLSGIVLIVVHRPLLSDCIVGGDWAEIVRWVW